MLNLSKDLEFWMTNLPDKLRTTPLIHLAIPGSHDSTTFAITKKSGISPDARNPIQFLKFLGPILRPVMLKWSVTQNVDINEQLNAGIRYFDLRISTKPNMKKFYFVHNLYSECVTPILEHINHFLDQHPKEIVILDCQHFYNIAPDDHRRLISLFLLTFGKKLLPYYDSLSRITLDFMDNNHFQVVLIYRAEYSIVEELLWPSACFQTPWPNTTRIPNLINYLDWGLKNRDFSIGFVSQIVLTPTVWYVCKHIFGSLKSKCVLPLDQQKYEWLNQQKPGKGGLNIVISDFISLHDFKFPKEVVDLNLQLLKDA